MEAWNEKAVYTTEYIYNLPNGERCELIDGQIYSMSPPGRIHQKLVNRLCQFITNYIDSKQGNCEVYPAPFAVFLNKDDKTYVEPDISIICDTDKLDDRGCNGAPDWIIEIVSPGSKKMDYFTKLFKYRTAGVREYWIVDPKTERIMVYDFDGETMEEYNFTQKIKASIYKDFEIDFSKIR